MGGQGQVGWRPGSDDGRPGSVRKAARVRLIGGQGQVMGVQGRVDGRPVSGRLAARVR
jgi:hypothetical protein